MKKDICVKIAARRLLANGCVILDLVPAGSERFPEMYPGQFVNIRVPYTDGVFLRRPISICDYTDGCLTLYIKPVGKGSRRLCELVENEEFEVLLPLGRGFSYGGDSSLNLLVGGGVGIAPLLYLGRRMCDAGMRVEFLLGGASAADLELTEVFEKVGKVHVTTVDGSMGVKGFVTDHPILNDRDLTHIYACGPTPMMKALAGVARHKEVSMQASLENHMACGLGACLCCVEDTREGNRCVCTDGPVFDIDELKW